MHVLVCVKVLDDGFVRKLIHMSTVRKVTLDMCVFSWHRAFRCRILTLFAWCTCVTQFVYVQCVCVSILYTCIVYAWVCVCDFSVFGPLKGSCRAEGEEKITGADIICFCHVDLASGLTHWPSPTRTPSGCTCTHAPTRRTHPTHTDTHMRLCRDKVRA